MFSHSEIKVCRIADTDFTGLEKEKVHCQCSYENKFFDRYSDFLYHNREV